jgi:DNA-binding PadR family transcriptional regulator
MAQDERRDLFPGALEMMILETLRRRSLHGYAIAKHIRETSDEVSSFDRMLYGITRVMKPAES